MTGNATTWMQEVPDGWAVQPLRGLAIFFKGLPITKTDLADRGIPVVSYGQVHSKLNSGVALNDELVRFIPEDLTAGGKGSLLRRGDLVFADTSEDLDGVGNAICIDSDKTIYSGYHTVTLRLTTDRLYSRYLAYLILTDEWRSQLRSYANGVKVFSVTHAMLKRTYTLIPPIKEQHSIVNELDSATKAIHSSIEILERQVAILNDYRKSIIQETVTKGLDPTVDTKPSGIDWIGDIPIHWQLKKVKNISESRNGLDYVAEDVCGPDDTGATLVVRSSNLDGNGMVFDDCVYLNKRIPSALRLQKDDIVIVRTNGSRELVGKNALVSENGIGTIGAFMLLCRSPYPRYLHWILNSQLFPRYLGTFETSTVNQITNGNLRNMVIPFCPDAQEREAICDYLDAKCAAIDRLIAGKHKQLETLRAQRQSLINEYVTGKRRVV